jgi:peptide/nickel transport system permease protein
MKSRFHEYIYCPPQRIHFIDDEGKFHVRPFVYAYVPSRDPKTLARVYTVDKTRRHPIYFFVRGEPYKLWNLIPLDVHLFGTKDRQTLFLFGTDKLGRDLFSRTLHASRVSLSIGLAGVAISFILGSLLGGISGYYGGAPDMVIQRLIEFLMCIPHVPLWMTLSAALPPEWPPLQVYFGITIILSLLGWCPLARVVRGKLLSLREEDYVMAAKIAGARERRIIAKHLLPSFASYLIVHLTLAVPGMILGETALSFLGLGLRPPVVSWGVLLSEAQKVKAVYMNPWLLIPGVFVIVAVLAFNFVGDGLRDAADPYK